MTIPLFDLHVNSSSSSITKGIIHISRDLILFAGSGIGGYSNLAGIWSRNSSVLQGVIQIEFNFFHAIWSFNFNFN